MIQFSEIINDLNEVGLRSNPKYAMRLNNGYTEIKIFKKSFFVFVKITHWNLIAPRKSSPLFHVRVWLNRGVGLIWVAVLLNLPRQFNVLTSEVASNVPKAWGGWTIVRGWIRKPLNSLGLESVTWMELPRMTTFVSTWMLIGERVSCCGVPWLGVKVKQALSGAPSGNAEDLARRKLAKNTRSFMVDV